MCAEARLPRPFSPEEQHHLSDVLDLLQPMGGHTLYDEEGRVAGNVCGARNVRPYMPGIRRALQEASEAEIDPAALYIRAVAMYEREDANRR